MDKPSVETKQLTNFFLDKNIYSTNAWKNKKINLKKIVKYLIRGDFTISETEAKLHRGGLYRPQLSYY